MGGFKEVSTDNSLPMITMAQTRKQRKGTDVEDFKEGILDISLPTREIFQKRKHSDKTKS